MRLPERSINVRIAPSSSWWSRIMALGVALTASGCLSETLIDNYEDREISADDQSDNPNKPSVGVTDVPVKPLGPSEHEPTLSIFRFGSELLAYRPLLASLSDSEVLLVAPTEGAAGPSLEAYSQSSQWPTRTRLFPDDPLPTAVASDDTGAIVLAGAMTRSVSYGGTGIGNAGQGFFVVKLDSNWEFVAGVGGDVSGSAQVSAVTVDAAHRVYVAINVVDDFGNELPEIRGYDASLHERFRIAGSMLGGMTGSLSTGMAVITSLSVSADGTLLVAGRSSAPLRLSDVVITPAMSALDGWYARCETETGRCSSGALLSLPFGTEPAGYVDLGEKGERLAATIFGGVSGTGATVTSVSAPYLLSGRIGSGELTQTCLGAEGQVDSLVVTSDGTSYVAGRLPTATLGGTGQYGFVAEVQADGSLSSQYVTSELGILSTAIAANRERVIWLAASTPRSPGQGAIADAVVLVRLEPKRASP
ncbi:MAG: hypothetical protein QM784_23490 [Polyangiaceae bacterium]